MGTHTQVVNDSVPADELHLTVHGVKGLAHGAGRSVYVKVSFPYDPQDSKSNQEAKSGTHVRPQAFTAAPARLTTPVPCLMLAGTSACDTDLNVTWDFRTVFRLKRGKSLVRPRCGCHPAPCCTVP